MSDHASSSSSAPIPSYAGDWIRLSKMAFSCELGVFAWERRRTQSLEVEIGLNLNLEPAAAGDLDQTLDYAHVLEQVRFLVRQGRWRLIESLAFALARHLLSPPAPGEGRRQVNAVFVRLSKPEALQGRAIPSVEVVRRQDWCGLSNEAVDAGTLRIEPLIETDETGAYHVEIGVGGRFELARGGVGQLVSGAARVGEKDLHRGDCFERNHDAPVIVMNSGATQVRLLFITSPPLDKRAI